MKAAYFIITIPAYLLSNLLLAFNVFNLRHKLDKCIQVVDEKLIEIPDFYIPYLIAAEDHRSIFHFGIDQAGIIRAIFRRVVCSEIQGASTIEQQFVRVVTGDYSYSIKRKLKEQLLAVLLSNRRGKRDIAKAYLAIAYYGTNCEGVKGIFTLLGHDLHLATENQVISIVARLKYPEPSANTGKWEITFSKRVTYIRKKHQHETRTSRQHIGKALEH